VFNLVVDAGVNVRGQDQAGQAAPDCHRAAALIPTQPVPPLLLLAHTDL
jgi:hypothetical protein